MSEPTPARCRQCITFHQNLSRCPKFQGKKFVEGIKEELSGFKYATIVHVGRDSNRVADCLAKEASTKVIDSVWLGDIPPLINLFCMIYLGNACVPIFPFGDTLISLMKRCSFV